VVEALVVLRASERSADSLRFISSRERLPIEVKKTVRPVAMNHRAKHSVRL
jgi:hypothetical protein